MIRGISGDELCDFVTMFSISGELCCNAGYRCLIFQVNCVVMLGTNVKYFRLIVL